MSDWLDRLHRLVVFPEGDVLAAPVGPFEVQCVAQTKKKTRCGNWIAHVGREPEPASCEINGELYEISGIDGEDAARWRAQHCHRHIGADVVDVVPVEWEVTGLRGELDFEPI